MNKFVFDSASSRLHHLKFEYLKAFLVFKMTFLIDRLHDLKEHKNLAFLRNAGFPMVLSCPRFSKHFYVTRLYPSYDNETTREVVSFDISRCSKQLLEQFFENDAAVAVYLPASSSVKNSIICKGVETKVSSFITVTYFNK